MHSLLNSLSFQSHNCLRHPKLATLMDCATSSPPSLPSSPPITELSPPISASPHHIHTPSSSLPFPFSPPPLRCSFSPSLHPLHDTVRSICDPWILQVAQPSSARHRQFLLDCLLPRYVCRLLPRAPLLDRLCATTKLIAWFTLADDVADSMATLGAAEQWSQSFLAALQEPHSRAAEMGAGASGGAARLLDALAELWEQISAEMTTKARERFVKAADEHLQAVILQSADRSAGSFRTTEDFMAIRRPASGFPMGLELAPYTLAMGPEEHELVLYHPLLAELRELTVDYMCICNDVLSCGLEVEKGDRFNLPCILQGSGAALTLPMAMECAADLAGRVDERCVEVLGLIKEDRTLWRWQRTVEMYVGTMVACMAGTIEWSYESARYRLPSSSSSSASSVAR